MYDMEADFSWFCDNKDAIISGRENQCALIKGGKVLGYFDTDTDAVSWAGERGLSMGEYIVQPCASDDEGAQYYHTGRYSFS